jgi:hypothetical protein
MARGQHSLLANFAAGAFDIVTGDLERLVGRPPKSLRDLLAGALKFSFGLKTCTRTDPLPVWGRQRVTPFYQKQMRALKSPIDTSLAIELTPPTLKVRRTIATA